MIRISPQTGRSLVSEVGGCWPGNSHIALHKPTSEFNPKLPFPKRFCESGHISVPSVFGQAIQKMNKFAC